MERGVYAPACSNDISLNGSTEQRCWDEDPSTLSSSICKILVRTVTRAVLHSVCSSRLHFFCFTLLLLCVVATLPYRVHIPRFPSLMPSCSQNVISGVRIHLSDSREF